MQRDPNLPRHVAVIMDGNGRWAQSRGLARAEGHRAGAESVRAVVRRCGELGIEALTLYSFSTENWGRPEDEVDALMTLLATYLQDEIGELMENGVRLVGIGQLDRLPVHVRQLLEQVTEMTAANDGLLLTLALSYGSRAELVQAIRGIAFDTLCGDVAIDEIDEALVDARLYTAGTPDPDLLIRTSGEMRLSNFLLWQLAYSELYVTQTSWPEFRERALADALEEYGRRRRRFGKTDEQIRAESC